MADVGLAAVNVVLTGFASELGVATAAVTKVIDAITQWVTALNPQLMAEFGRAVKDLQATLGTAFTGIFSILTGVIRQVAGIILPVMQALKPVIDQLTETLAAGMLPGARATAAILTALVPILSILATVFDAIQSILRPLYGSIEIAATILGGAFKLLELQLTPIIIVLKIFSTLMDGVAELLHLFAVVIQTVVQTVESFIKSLFAGIGINKIFDLLQTVIMKVITAMLVMVGVIAKVFGQDAFLNNLINNLKKEGQGGAVAAGQFSNQSFEEVNKAISLAAAQAAQGGNQAKKFDLSDVVQRLEAIQAGNGGLLGDIKTTCINILEWLKNPVGKTIDNVVHEAPNTLRRAARGDGLWGVVNPAGAAASSLYDWATK